MSIARNVTTAMTAAVLGVTAVPAAAHVAEIKFKTFGVSTGFVAGTVPCPPGQISITATSEFGKIRPGDNWVGDNRGDACLWPQPDGSFKVTGTELFTGSLSGKDRFIPTRTVNCGTGTFKFAFTSTFSPPDANEWRTVRSTAWLVPDSGTGNFTSLSKFDYTAEGEISPELVETGRIVGYATCAPA